MLERHSATNYHPLKMIGMKNGVKLNPANKKGPMAVISSKRNNDNRRTDRTSTMLIAVLLLFLITEFPQGIIHLLSGWYGPTFFR